MSNNDDLKTAVRDLNESIERLSAMVNEMPGMAETWLHASIAQSMPQAINGALGKIQAIAYTKMLSEIQNLTEQNKRCAELIEEQRKHIKSLEEQVKDLSVRVINAEQSRDMYKLLIIKYVRDGQLSSEQEAALSRFVERFEEELLSE